MINEIKAATNGEWLSQSHPEAHIGELSIDSRSIERPDIALFIALKTNLRNGHSFLHSAWQKGVRSFLISEPVDISSLPDANILLVPDTLIALQQIAATHRAQFHIPVIGITGSNGKTVIKEWLFQLLSPHSNIIRSPKSFNSQIGVPLSAWLMKKAHQLAIFEAGISQPGEMKQLQHILQPTIGIFTNIGEAHNEGFTGLRQKANEKLLLFRYAKQLIYCLDQAIVHDCITHWAAGGGPVPQLFTWSRLTDAVLRILRTGIAGNVTSIAALYKGKEISISIPFTDDASVENAIHCWCAMLLLGSSQKDIKAGMLQLQQVSMRLELRQGINDCTIINDTYNSDITSLQLALNYLDQQKQHTHHTVIMSDILQPGKADEELYDEVTLYISRRNVQRFIGIGPALYKNRAVFKKHKKFKSIFFKSTGHFIRSFHTLTFGQEVILLKGARVFAFEQISLLLEQKVHQTVMSIDLSALKHNLDVFRAELKPGIKTMAMVKAFAYGSGSAEIAGVLQYSGIDYLAVAYTDEGIALRKAGIRLPIMVMSPDSSSFDRMITWKLEPELYNLRSFDAFVHIANTLQVRGYPVHIKLDTGMHRLGFNPGDIDKLIEKISMSPELHIASIFSHLAASDDAAEDGFTMQQAAAFELMSGRIIDSLPYIPLCHLCNSAGIVRHHQLHYSMVRLGLGLYGVDSSMALRDKLKQISTLKTSIAQVRNIPAGDNIGYGHHTIAPHDMRIATICIGYADGYPRSLGHGRAYVLINGKQAATTGSICMDMCMVDITHIPDAKEGDDAIIFSTELPVTQLAEWAGTISYEIMTNISQRVKRVYVRNDD